MTLAAQKAFEEAVLQEKSGDLDKALASYLKAQELAPQDTEIAYRAASALLQAGYLEEAQSQLRRIVFAEPEHLPARASLGNCQLLLGDKVNAKQNFVEVLEFSPDNRNALYGLATIYLEEGNLSAVASPVQRLSELMPEAAAVQTLLAEVMARTGQQASAIAAYRKALTSDRNHLKAMLGLGEILLLRKRYDEVIELCLSACRIAPTDALPLEMLSDALAGKGELADAMEAAQEALRIKPNSSGSLLRLSILSRKRGEMGAAMKFALKAHDADQTASGPLNALGAALAAQKYANQARTVLTGLSAGKPLEAKARAFVEALVRDLEKAEASKSAETAGNETSAKASADETSGNVSAGEEDMTAAVANVAAPDGGKTTVQTDPADMPEKKPQPTSAAVQFGSDDEPLPNVLGLRRQDRT